MRAHRQRGIFWLHLVEAHRGSKRHPEFDFGSSEVARYYGEVAFDDEIVGRVLEYLRSSGHWRVDRGPLRRRPAVRALVDAFRRQAAAYRVAEAKRIVCELEP